MVYFVFFICSCALTFSSCKREKNRVASGGARQLVAVSTPPFATKEPERYQALRTITSTESGSQETDITRTFIARDGNLRREEYERIPGEKIVYLEIPAGRFVLLPAAKLIADLEGGDPTGTTQPPSDDLSTDRLLNQTAVETRYEQLAVETINGRAATKYRVLTGEETGGTTSSGQTLIWIDDALSMPVKWETTMTTGDNEAKTTMELSGISLNVDAASFELPVDYRKIEMRALRARMREDVHPRQMLKTMQ